MPKRITVPVFNKHNTFAPPVGELVLICADAAVDSHLLKAFLDGKMVIAPAYNVNPEGGRELVEVSFVRVPPGFSRE